jgi:hypothetical protein
MTSYILDTQFVQDTMQYFRCSAACVIVIADAVGSVGDPDEYKLRHNGKIYNQSRKRSDRGTPSGQTPESASPTYLVMV